MPQRPKKQKINFSDLKLWQIALSGLIGASLGEIATLPLDTIKVTMQLQQGKYSTALNCGLSIWAKESLSGLFKGAKAGLVRQLFFGTTRLAIYDYAINELKTRRNGVDNVSMGDRVALGITSGALAMAIANPSDVIKVRIQAASKTCKTANLGFCHYLVKIAKEEGFKGFYQSLPANLLRNSSVTAAELAIYDQIKTTALRKGLLGDTIQLHFMASAAAGFSAALVSSPFDVIKSTVMAGKVNSKGLRIPFGSVLEAVKHVYQSSKYSIKGFYQGFGASCQRIVAYNIIVFMVKEQLNLYFYKEWEGHSINSEDSGV